MGHLTDVEAGLDLPITIDPTQHHRLGLHVVEYAQRAGLNHAETAELLAMVGL